MKPLIQAQKTIFLIVLLSFQASFAQLKRGEKYIAVGSYKVMSHLYYENMGKTKLYQIPGIEIIKINKRQNIIERKKVNSVTITDWLSLVITNGGFNAIGSDRDANWNYIPVVGRFIEAPFPTNTSVESYAIGFEDGSGPWEGGDRIIFLSKNDLHLVRFENMIQIERFHSLFPNYPNSDEIIRQSLENVSYHYGALLNLRKFYPNSKYRTEIDKLIKIHEDKPSGGMGPLINLAISGIRENVQNNRQSFETNSNGCFQELEDEEKSICGTKMKVKSLRCPNGNYTRLFWAVKSETYLSCLKYEFRDDAETGWFRFQSNIIDPNDGIFLTKDRSFDKAARLACGCDK